jgi:hypothetical protein
MKSNMEVPQNFKVELPYYPVITLLGIYLIEHTQDVIEPLAHPCILQDF